MAIIKCPKCNEKISDKSLKCIHCGKPLIDKTKLFCEECGFEVKKSDKVCSNCGCPTNDKKVFNETQKVEVTKFKFGTDISPRKKKIGIIFALILIFLFVLLMLINISNKEKANEKYKENLSVITYKMLSGAATAEECGNLIKKVWYNSIWNEDDSETDKFTKNKGEFNDDFNDSLSNLFNDSDFMETTVIIEQNQDEVNKLMVEMKNPPKDWDEAYTDLKDYNEAYLTITNLCTNPSGNLQTYSTNFSDADSAAINGYNKMKVYLDY